MAKTVKLSKRDQTLIDSLAIGTENEKVRNPFSGVEVELKPTEVALYDFIKGCEITQHYDKMQQGLALFAKLNVSAYMDLLD